MIAGLKAQGIAIIYISHRMEEIYQLADRVSVLSDSAYVGTLERSELSAGQAGINDGRSRSLLLLQERTSLL